MAKYFTISSDKSKLCLDSLKRLGFKKSAKNTDITALCKFNLSLFAIKFHRLEFGDSLFKFIYKYELTANNRIITRLDTIYVTEKQKVLNGIKNKKYSFTVDNITGTTINDVSITSLDLYNVNKWAHFQSGTTVGFYY